MAPPVAGPPPDGAPRVAMPGGHTRRRWKAAVFAAAAVAIVVVAGWALLGSRFLVVRSVRVTGTGPLVSRGQVLSAAAIPAGLPLIRVDGAAVARRVERLTGVQSARVSRDWPSTVVISVTPRTEVFAVALRPVGSGGYGLADRFGVIVRRAAHRPPRLPLLAVPGVAATSLRGNPAVAAAAVVLTELPRWIAHRVTQVTAAGPSQVSLRLTGGVTIIWGDTARPRQKATELNILMRHPARTYDVSPPNTASTTP
jgi:cell division protein FtsQ